MTKDLRIAVDIGGTFTDTVLVDGHGRNLATTKTPTTPQNPTLGAMDGVRFVLKEANRDIGEIKGFVHGTTLATNALIERRGARVATITNAGFRDILEIAYERRHSQYEINIEKPDLIVPRSRSFTIGGRMDYKGNELTPLDQSGVADLVRKIAGCGADAVAICLLHSYANDDHEIELQALLRQSLPGLVISISSEVSPEAREFDRLCTTIANAYIQPLMAGYLQDFARQFSNEGLQCPVLLMTASGGMTTIETAARLPIRLVESGPAGGAILAAQIARDLGEDEVLSFDMGGTTAKLCLIDHAQPQSARKFEISRAARFVKGSGMPVRIPVLEMIEIGAGGGSIANIDGLGRLQVGPHSAGSDPGPAAFCKGGANATVTDADVALGYIDPTSFAEGRLKIDRELANEALLNHIGDKLKLTPAESAFGMSDIVDENMAAAGRMHCVESGKDLAKRTMIAFGGNGPLHATRVARRAGVKRIIIAKDPGVGSAVGFLFAPISFEVVRSRYSTLDDLQINAMNSFLNGMIDEAMAVVKLGTKDQDFTQKRIAYMRYQGQGHEIEIELPSRDLKEDDIEALKSAFEKEYSRQFSRAVPGMTIEILNWAVSVSTINAIARPKAKMVKARTKTPERKKLIICDVSGNEVSAGIFERGSLLPGDEIEGPALVLEPQTTTLVSIDFSAIVDASGNLILERRSAEMLR